MSNKLSRRDFMKIAGGSAAVAAVLTGCGPEARYVVRQPYTQMPEYNHTGQSTYFASTCRECPAGCGIIVRTMEGRAIKVEGNPDHPINRGKLCSRGFTSVQGAYNPDRFQGPRHQAKRGSGSFDKIGWDTAMAQVKGVLAGSGSQVAFLMGQAPDHLFDLAKEITSALGAGDPLRYSMLGMLDGAATWVEAAKQVFGSPSQPYFDLAQSDVVFDFGADFLTTWQSPVVYSRAYSQMRRGASGKRGYLVVFDPHQSLTAGNADEWIAVKPGSEAALAAALGRLVAEARGMPVPAAYQFADVAAASLASGVSQDTLRRLAGLFSRAAHPVAMAGGNALAHAGGLAAAKLVLLLNALVDNVGKPGGIYLPALARPISTLKDIQALVAKMAAGQVKALFIHGVNPVFDLPASLGFTQALAKVPMVVALSSFPDETASQADLILPDHTPLESWGYHYGAGADRGAVSGSQPVIAPLYDTRASADVLISAAKAVGGALASITYNDEVDFIQSKIVPLIGKGGIYDAGDIKHFWPIWQQKGGWWTPAADLPKDVPTQGLTQVVQIPSAAAAQPGYDLSLISYATLLGDGSGANRPWLQETPNGLTTAMWNAWVEINPETAAKLGIKDDDIVQITSAVGSVEAIAYLYPAIEPGCVAVPFGQGHTVFGRYAQGRGFNPAAVMTLAFTEAGDLAFADTRVKLSPTGKTKQLARLESRAGIYGDGKKNQ